MKVGFPVSLELGKNILKEHSGGMAQSSQIDLYEEMNLSLIRDLLKPSF